MSLSADLPLSLNRFNSDDDARLRETLKRCSTTTYIAAREFRKTGNLEHLPTIVQGGDRTLRGARLA
jgi:hypothetical protein